MKRWLIVAIALPVSAQTLGSVLKDGIVIGGGNKKQAEAPPKQAPPAPQTQERRAVAAPEGPPAPAGDAAFQMSLPPGWRAQVQQNGAVVARSGDQASLILIAPVRAANGTASDWLRRAAAQALAPLLPNAQVTGVYPSRMGASGATAAVDFRSAAGPGRANILCFLGKGAGAVYVIAGPAATFGQQRGAMVAALRSFRFNGVTERRAAAGSAGGAAPAANLSFRRFQDPNEASFTVDVPVGWQVQGGTIRKNTVDVRSAVWIQSPDGQAVLRIGDTNIGTFAEPNPTMAMGGFREGSQYSPGYGTVMTVRRYLPGVVFAQEYAMGMARSLQASNFQMRENKQRPDLSQSNPNIGQSSTAGEVSFSCTRGGRENAGYTLAATSRMGNSGMYIWNMLTLVSWIAPPERAGEINAAFERMLKTFQINPQWARQQQQTTAETSRIVSETNDRVSKIITDSYWSRQRSQERSSERFSDYIRGRVRLQDPDTGETLEGTAGSNYYWRVRGTDTIVGSDTPDRPTNIDVSELEEIR
ncbi:MAG: hypothetical protein U0Q16_32825 [Bryobacteraceae bacterium]